MTKHVEITMRFEEGKGLTHFCDRQEAVIKAIKASDAGENGANLFKAATSSLWSNIEKGKDFIIVIPGLSIIIKDDG